MITYERQIMKIVKITNMELVDNHKPKKQSPLRDVIFISLANGEVKRLDLFAEMDATNIDYWDYKKTNKSKEKVIFSHWDLDRYASTIEE